MGLNTKKAAHHMMSGFLEFVRLS